VAKSIEQSRGDIAAIVPHLRQGAKDAMRRATDGAVIEIAIIAKNPDGTRQIGCSFRADEFLSDMEEVFPPTEESKSEAELFSFLDNLGVNRV
jgi:hypothetical protein